MFASFKALLGNVDEAVPATSITETLASEISILVFGKNFVLPPEEEVHSISSPPASKVTQFENSAISPSKAVLYAETLPSRCSSIESIATVHDEFVGKGRKRNKLKNRSKAKADTDADEAAAMPEVLLFSTFERVLSHGLPLSVSFHGNKRDDMLVWMDDGNLKWGKHKTKARGSIHLQDINSVLNSGPLELCLVTAKNVIIELGASSNVEKALLFRSFQLALTRTNDLSEVRRHVSDFQHANCPL
jgi:hypothetical protein